MFRVVLEVVLFLKSRQASCKCPFPGLSFVTGRDVPLPCTPDPIHTEACFQLRHTIELQC